MALRSDPVKCLKIAAERAARLFPSAVKAWRGLRVLFGKGPGELLNAWRRYQSKSPEDKQLAGQLDRYSGRLFIPGESDVAYDAGYQEDMSFAGCRTDIRALAFYLPQYHTFPENDAWWGKGFTEWTNVRSGTPRFKGHYQPRLPHPSIGCYCLDDIGVMARQAALARAHGLAGFVFYYYWFSGRRLMEKPVDLLLDHPEIDCPFCLCWANENWTRAWDGRDRDVLIAQRYAAEDDSRFIPDLKKYLDDPRYIRIGGKPLILVYRPDLIPDCRKTFAAWRASARALGLGEILIWTCRTADNNADILRVGDAIDAEVEFPPHNMWPDSRILRNVCPEEMNARIFHYGRLVDERLEEMAEPKKNKASAVPLHRGCTMGWDNSARRKNGFTAFYGYSPEDLYRWMNGAIEATRTDFAPEERFLFLNAWNEWGEGTYLEPDAKTGWTNINTVSRALFGLPYDRHLTVTDPETAPSVLEKERSSPRIAVQIHLFYPELAGEMIRHLNCMPEPYDLYVSTDTEEKKTALERVFTEKCSCERLTVSVFPNRGRDVAPFLLQTRPILRRYEYICHLHGKKTVNDCYGDDWRRYLLRHLLRSRENIAGILSMFDRDPRLGLVMPETFPPIADQMAWSGNKADVQALLDRLNPGFTLPGKPVFPAGNMFWARTSAVEAVFSLPPDAVSFPEEAGQVNGTPAHQLERLWCFAVRAAGYDWRKVINPLPEALPLSPRKRLAIYVHYDPDGKLGDDDLKTVGEYADLVTDLIFVSNGPLDPREAEKLRRFANTRLLVRENRGLDFGGWRDAILRLGWEKIEGYDELILLNNSCLPPLFPMAYVFADMENRPLDFWGMTLFPYCADGRYLHRKSIPRHLQSYFLVFGAGVLRNAAFRNFWADMTRDVSYLDVVGDCESRLTPLLENEGFACAPYIRETGYLNRLLRDDAIPYTRPFALALLGCPLIKKKAASYMDAEERNKLRWYLKQRAAHVPEAFSPDRTDRADGLV